MMKEISMDLDVFRPLMEELEQAKMLLNSVCSLIYLNFEPKDRNLTTVAKVLSLFKIKIDGECEYDLYLEYLEKESPMGEDHPAIVWRKKCPATGDVLAFIASLAQDIVIKVIADEIDKNIFEGDYDDQQY